MSTPTVANDREVLIAYLKMKVEQADWHGVSDAANDLRVLEAQQGSSHPQITHVTHLRPFACEELGIHQHQQKQGEAGYVWHQGCQCVLCSATTQRYAQEQAAILGIRAT